MQNLYEQHAIVAAIWEAAVGFELEEVGLPFMRIKKSRKVGWRGTLALRRKPALAHATDPLLSLSGIWARIENLGWRINGWLNATLVSAFVRWTSGVLLWEGGLYKCTMALRDVDFGCNSDNYTDAQEPRNAVLQTIPHRLRRIAPNAMRSNAW